MKLESKKRLRDFVERAERIRNYPYFKNGKKIVGYEARGKGEEWQVDFYQPDTDQLDAILLTLRLFFQDKE